MSRRQKRLRRLAVINLLIAIVAVAGIGYAAYTFSQQPGYDQETLCPFQDAGAAPPPHTVVILDKTDSYTPDQARLIASVIRRTKDRLEMGERITLAVLDGRGNYNPRGALSLCNPGRGEQVNPLYTNPRLVQERYEARFGGPLEAALADLMEPRQAPRSPILETLARQAQTEAFGDDAERRRVILISDMLQNSDIFTVYGAGAGVPPKDLPRPSAAARTLMERFGDDLTGVQLEVRLIPRPRWEDAQRSVLREYWGDLAAELGMRLRWRDL